MNKKLPRGIAPVGLVKFAKSDKDLAKPLRVKTYKKNKLKINKVIRGLFKSPLSLMVIGWATKASGYSLHRGEGKVSALTG